MRSVFCMLLVLLSASISFAACPQGDITGDCKVNMDDLTQIAAKWLTDGVPAPDIACDGDVTGDCKVNMADIAQVAADWLIEGVPSPDITWVSISDPGISGHEGFTGDMSKYETTNVQYCQYLNAAKASGAITVSGDYIVGAGEYYYYLAGSGYTYNGATNGGAARINWTGSSFTVDAGFENHPVTYVSWYGATAFASYYGWRLPTEWEWQAAADYNGSYVYGCGTAINNSMANCYNSAHPHGTTAVGAFGSYGYGLCDMAGNVWEWTSSEYSSGSIYRVLRGGSWDDRGYFCSVSYRSGINPSFIKYYLGFRVCR